MENCSQNYESCLQKECVFAVFVFSTQAEDDSEGKQTSTYDEWMTPKTLHLTPTVTTAFVKCSCLDAKHTIIMPICAHSFWDTSASKWDQADCWCVAVLEQREENTPLNILKVAQILPAGRKKPLKDCKVKLVSQSVSTIKTKSSRLRWCNAEANGMYC